jgi:integrase
MIGYKAIIEFRDGIVGSPNTKRNVMRLVRPAFDRAVKLEHIGKNPFDLLDRSEKPKPSKSRVIAFKTGDMQKLLRHVERPAFDPLWRALVLFGFDLGAEPEEFLGVQVGDFNWTTGYVHIQRTCVEAGGELIVKPEMKAEGRNRNEALAPRTLKAIADLVGPSRALSDHVFSPDGKPWSYNKFIKLWRKLLVGAGVTHLPPLSMRHTMASIMLGRGESLAAVSKRLGHASIVTTLNHYVHAMPGDTARLGRVSGTIFDELLGPTLSSEVHLRPTIDPPNRPT